MQVPLFCSEGLSVETQCTSGYSSPSKDSHSVIHLMYIPAPSYSGGDFETDIESINPRGSTIEDVNTLLLETVPEYLRESSSGDQSSFIERRPFLRANPLALSSRALIKQCFQKAELLCLYEGHLTIALIETEIGSILRVVADQTAKASYEMMENLLRKASGLNFTSSPRHKADPKKLIFPRPTVAASESSLKDASHGYFSDTSGALRSDDDFASIGYSYEHSEE